MEVLWITPKWPLPAEDGARVATCSLLTELSKQGVQIDLLSVTGEDEVVDRECAQKMLGVRSCVVVRRKPGERSLWKAARHLPSFFRAPKVPITMQRYHSIQVRRGIDRILHGSNGGAGWDAMVYDGLHVAAHAAQGGEYARNGFSGKIIYRAHNRESALWEQQAQEESSPLLKHFIRYQAGRVKVFEDSLARSVDCIAAVSKQDLDLFCAIDAQVRGAVVPIGYHYPLTTPQLPRESLHLLFIGRLDWSPNRRGLEWFLSKVWPAAAKARSEISLTIAGSGDGGWLSDHRDIPGIEIKGRVQELAPLYAASHLCILPLFLGSGTRVKAIEAASFGRTCLSTALGVEGLPLQPAHSFLRAESAADWIEILSSVSLEELRRLGTQAHYTLQRDFNPQRAAQSFLNLLRE